MSKMSKNKILKIVFQLFFILIILLFVKNLWDFRHKLATGWSDFTGFYMVGKIVLAGELNNFYNLETQHKYTPFADNGGFFLPNFHPPFEALLSAVFAHFPYFTAYILWTIFSMVLLYFSIVFIKKNYFFSFSSPLFTIPTMFLASLAFFPAQANIINGQDSILFLFLLVLSIMLRNQNKYLLGGVILGCSVFKPHLTIPLAIGFSLYSHFSFFLGFLLSSGFWTLVSLLMVRLHGVKDLFHMISVANSESVKYGVNPTFLPNLRGLLERHIDLLSSANVTLISIIIWLIGIVLVFFISYKFSKSNTSILDSIIIILALLCSFHIGTHDLILLIIPISVGLKIASEYKSKTKSLLVLVLLFLLSPIPYSMNLGAERKFEGLIISLFILIGICFYLLRKVK